MESLYFTLISIIQSSFFEILQIRSLFFKFCCSSSSSRVKDDRSEILIQVADEKNERVPVFNGHCDEITALSVNGDGCLLASGDSGGKYCIWEIASRQCLKVALRTVLNLL